jgi:DNA/RNA-binding domain of Phe-tRNA-synthetase-like protein
MELPEPGEVIFADNSGRAHARRWTNRQSAYSAVQDDSTTVLIIAEAMHAGARSDVHKLMRTIADELEAGWSITTRSQILDALSPLFEF